MFTKFRKSQSMCFLIVFAFAVYASICTTSIVDAKIFMDCEFVHQLYKYNVPEWQIPTLTCIAQRESGFNSSKLDDFHGKHGIFQISEERWCSSDETPGKICDIPCSKLRDNFLEDDIYCALKMYRMGKKVGMNGYDVWPSYFPYCSVGFNKKYVKFCKIDIPKKYLE